ncbi:MAG: sugar ABC transporter permease [Chloroflexi bacterium]|nr:sugar ABC transporter permease [Chloroflexota bacterium]
MALSFYGGRENASRLDRPGRRGHSRRERQELLWAGLFLLPNLLGVLVFSVGPLIFSLAMTTMDWQLVKPPSFVGAANLGRLVKDDVFWMALANTITYVLLYVPLLTLGSFVVAIVLDRKLRGITLYRTIFFMPSVVLFVSVAMLWQWLYEPQNGVINYVLGLVGIPGPPWLSSRLWALPSIIVMNVWRHAGYYSLIFLAGLQAIPDELHEAAQVDGASALQRLRYLTIPLIFPTTFFVVVTSLIAAFQLFGEAFVMTKGGPGYATTTLVYYIYRMGFEAFRMGYAALIAWVLFLLIFAVTLVQWRIARERGYGFQE